MVKKNKVLILLICALLVSTTTYAQHHRDRQVIRAYPSLGATASQMRGDELRGFKKWGFNAGVGAVVSLDSRDMFHLSVEANYSQRGSFNNTNDPYSIYQFTLNYVEIPLTFHFTDPFGGMTFGVGLIYGRLVQQPHGIIRYSPDYFVPDTSNMTFLRNDLSAAIDFRFHIWKGLMMNIRWQHSLLPVKRSWSFTEYNPTMLGGQTTWSNKVYNSSITMRLIYVFGEPAKKYNAKKGKQRKK